MFAVAYAEVRLTACPASGFRFRGFFSDKGEAGRHRYAAFAAAMTGQLHATGVISETENAW